MGFDVYGIKPNGHNKPDDPDWEEDQQVKAYYAWQDNTPGAYFRNNVWGWHPTWDFIHEHCKDIFTTAIEDELIKADSLDDFYNSCHHNDGCVIPKRIALEISARLEKLDDKGKLEQWEVECDIIRERRPKEDCDLCDATGTRKGWEGWHSEESWLKHHNSLKATDTIPRASFKWANQMRGCNGCNGTGKKESFANNYIFAAENVREFSKFAKLSGGFKIW